MREAVIVSTARTPIGKAYRGAFNDTTSPALAAHAITHAVARAKIDPGEVEDVVMGTAIQQGTASPNIARLSLLRAGLPQTVPGQSIDRQCASGMMAIATAAKQVISDNMQIAIGGGVESVSMNQTKDMFVRPDPWLIQNLPSTYMQMLETAEIVADRYGISREAQDEYALRSQQRTHAAQQAGKFDDEIVPLASVMKFTNRETGETSDVETKLEKDEGNRPETELSGLNGLKLVFKGGQVVKEGKYITAGNASQLSDGASAAVLMEGKEAEKRGLSPLGIYRGMAVAGTKPDEMGIGPVFAVPKLLEKNGLKMDDIGLWELNEAFAVQVLYCRDKLGIPDELLNVNGGAISIGHPYGMSGARMVGHALIEGKRRGAKFV
ncbi:MAG: acetyl-CoA C-acyltransferase, partial [Marinicaulis sp.]|nr:acetyl-CoA C-acyltransferase [Marinicaulis sp.]